MPLWLSNDSSFRSKVETFFVEFPKMIAMAKKASNQRTDSPIIMDIFDMIIRTKTQRDMELKQLNILDADEEESKKMLTQSFLLRAESKIRISELMNLTESLKALTLKVQSQKGANSVFEDITKATKISELPSEYKKLFQTLQTYWKNSIQQMFTDPAKVNKAKKILKITPKKALLGVISVANPFTLMEKSINLFLKKPLLSKHNLIQMIALEIADVSKTELQIKNCKKNLTFPNVDALLSKIENWVDKNYIPNPTIDDKDGMDPNDPARTSPNYNETLKSVLLSTTVEPLVAASVVEGLNEKDAKFLFNYLFYCTRLKDKMVFIDLLGNEEFITIYKEVMPYVLKPINQIYLHGDVGTLLKELFKLLEKCLALAQDSKMPQDRKENQYGVEIKIFTEVFYQSIRKIVINDKGILYDVIHWFLNLVESNLITVDVESLLSQYLAGPGKDKNLEEIKKEISSFSAFSQLEFQLKKEGKLTVYNCPFPSLPILFDSTTLFKSIIKQSLKEISMKKSKVVYKQEIKSDLGNDSIDLP